jgi:hypothetical protein
MRHRLILLAPSGRVMFGHISGNGLRARSGVTFQRADGGMARPRKQDRGIGPILGGMRQGGMS